MAKDARPNILFFFTDDQRFDTINALGNKDIITPNLDKLVARATTFTNAHIMGGSCAAVCMPSRAMLMTGRSLWHLQDRGQEIPPEHATMPETLGKAGYKTFGIGKWHNGKTAFNRSFSGGGEIYFGGMCDHWNVPAYDYDPEGKYECTLPMCADPAHSNKVIHRNADHISSGKHSSELFADTAEKIIREYDSDDPFFLYVSFMAPHDPRTMPQKYLDMYDIDKIPLPENYKPLHPFDNGEMDIRDEMLEAKPRTEDAIRRHQMEYYAMITHADAEMARVLKALEDSGKADNTIIIFAGDNGLAVGRHGLMGKQNMYEHSLRVPLLFAGPEIPEGETRDANAYLFDIFPTLCDILDIDTPASVDGKSLLPAFANAEEKIRDRMYFAYRNVQRCIKEDASKLIEYNVNGKRTTQLFDIEKDPWELDDLSQKPEHAATVKDLKEKLFQLAEELDDTTGIDKDFWAVG